MSFLADYTVSDGVLIELSVRFTETFLVDSLVGACGVVYPKKQDEHGEKNSRR